MMFTKAAWSLFDEDSIDGAPAGHAIDTVDDTVSWLWLSNARVLFDGRGRTLEAFSGFGLTSITASL
jgi:hypothetical protein